jgi:hypothetical protein
VDNAAGFFNGSAPHGLEGHTSEHLLISGSLGLNLGPTPNYNIVGGDIHIAIDGNFYHRHLRGAGNDEVIYEPQRFISKDYVNTVGLRIDNAWKQKGKKRTLKLADEVIDACKDSYHAAKGDKDKAATKRCDSTGLMLLVCRHNIPLFLTDIDTPGEQQKYAVSLIEYLLRMVPAHANVVVLYDVGCVLDCSLQMVSPIASTRGSWNF